MDEKPPFITQFHPLVKNFGTAYPTTNLFVGYPFFRSDLGQWYYYDGAIWQLTSASGSVADASTTVKGATKLSVAPVLSTNPIAAGDNDPRLSDARTPTGAAGGSLASTYPNPTLSAVGTAATYNYPVAITTNAEGRVSAATSGSAPVTSVSTNAPLTGGGGTILTLGLAITTTSDGGAVVKQSSTPGTQQTGHANLSGTIKADKFDGATAYLINGLEWLRRGTSFPGSPTDGQQFYRTDFRTNFEYVNADTAWRQITIPSYASSFPASPVTGLRVYRLDRTQEYFYDGTRWLTTQRFDVLVIPRDTQVYSQASHSFDFAIPYYNINGWYLEKLQLTLNFTTAQSNTNFYTWDVATFTNSTGAATAQTASGGLVVSKPFTTASQWVGTDSIYNVALANTQMGGRVAFTPTAAPGTWGGVCSMTYRLIG